LHGLKSNVTHCSRSFLTLVTLSSVLPVASLPGASQQMSYLTPALHIYTVSSEHTAMLFRCSIIAYKTTCSKYVECTERNKVYV
jgi:hypothetical protein